MRRRDLLIFLAAAGSGALSALARTVTFTDNEQVRAFIAEMQQKHGFAPAMLEQFFSRLNYNPKVLRLLNVPENDTEPPPLPPVYWQQYRRQRLTPKKIAAGISFYRQHRAALQQAGETYGVPPAVTTAIIGIETNYGKHTGRYPVAETLATLAFGHPRRGDEFRHELAEFLLYVRDARLDPFSISGSYAGAIGMAQFMPSNMRKFAIDSDGDARINLFSAPDAVASIGNFLIQHGWVRDTDISYPAQIAGAANAKQLIEKTRDNSYRPLMTYAELLDYGVTTSAPAQTDARYLFIDLENRYDNEYRVGTVNFYALTRYNKSFKYAAVVTDLARMIKKGIS